MKILFASAHPYIPQIAGGAQSSTHALAVELMARGHQVSVLSGLTGDGFLGLRARVFLKLTGRGLASDTALGYPIHRAWHAAERVSELLAQDRPDVAVLQSGKPVPIARAFLEHGVPTVIYLRNVEFDDLGGDIRSLGPIETIANSAFTAERFEAAFGVRSTVIYPLFRPELYRTHSRRRNVTFINPHPLKGVDIALEVARRCPDIPFAFIEGWTLAAAERSELLAQIASLPNVELRPRTRDMRQVYEDARIVLAPSQWEEAFGRIAAEAHFSGIPVVATRCGGLPEAVGPGGVLVDRGAPVEHWVEAVRSLWRDGDRYDRLAKAAEAYSQRPDLDRKVQIGRLLAILERAADPAVDPTRRARAAAG